MNSKKRVSYEALFQFIEEKLLNLMPKSFHTDYEAGLRAALRNVYEGIELKGCWFHYCQAVRRKCRRTKNFFRSLCEHQNGHDIYKMLLALPLLPQDKIIEGFAFIRQQVGNPKLLNLLEPVFSYFNSWWLHSVKNFDFDLNLKSEY